MIKQLRLQAKIIVAVVAILIYTAVLVPNSFAHNIPLDKAREIARNYARLSRKESPRKYLHYATNCVSAYPGHNHIVRCVVHLQNERDKKAGVWTCTETIELYFKPHGNSLLDYRIYARSTSANFCGVRWVEKISAEELGS